jgi:very-short-patch-repair endonuclease
MDGPEGWPERFHESLGQFETAQRDRRRTCTLIGSLDNHILSVAQQYEPQHPLLTESVRALAHKYIDNAAFRLRLFLEKCESPIEEAMFLALYIAADYFCEGGVDVHWGPPRTPESYTAMIGPQAQLGEYRVDFLLRYRVVLPKIEDGMIVRDVESEKQMIVECDGHDFHERTKEQASSDKKRDRSLQAAGFLVFRFSGADIWRDVFGCATQALTALIEAANAEADRLSRA